MNPTESEHICGRCEEAIRNGTGDLRGVPGLIKRIIREGLWRSRCVPGRKIVELPSFRDLIVREPYEGWGQDPEQVYALLKGDAEAEELWRDAMTGKHGGDRKSKKAKETIKNDNVSLDRAAAVQGNSRAYLATRLKRTHPDLYQRLVDGEISAHAAAMKAGFANPRQIYLGNDVAKTAAKILELTDKGYAFKLGNLLCADKIETPLTASAAAHSRRSGSDPDS